MFLADVWHSASAALRGVPSVLEAGVNVATERAEVQHEGEVSGAAVVATAPLSACVYTNVRTHAWIHKRPYRPVKYSCLYNALDGHSQSTLGFEVEDNAMKTKAVLALLALAATPVLVGAQTVTPAPLSSPAAHTHHRMQGPGKMSASRLSPQARATMKQMHDAQSALKAKLFGSLSAAHRAYVAGIIGNLAISNKPDLKAAAAQIDSKLTASEKAAIVSAQAASMKQMESLGKQLRDEMVAQQQASGASPRPMPSHQPRRMHKPRTPDAGAFLLRAARPHGPGMMMHGKREHRPM